jgi:hypothetical protein
MALDYGLRDLTADQFIRVDIPAFKLLLRFDRDDDRDMRKVGCRVS